MKETIPRADEEVTAATFEAWLQHARPGDSYEYHRGYLTRDREKVVMLPAYGQYAHVFVEPTHSMAQAVWRAYRQGKAMLVQQKMGSEDYRYLAFKRRPERREFNPAQLEGVM